MLALIGESIGRVIFDIFADGFFFCREKVFFVAMFEFVEEELLLEEGRINRGRICELVIVFGILRWSCAI